MLYELGKQGVQFATFPETVVLCSQYFSLVQSPMRNTVGPEQRRLTNESVTVPSPATDAIGEAAAAAGVVVWIGAGEPLAAKLGAYLGHS